jgi:hypothetical protein
MRTPRRVLTALIALLVGLGVAGCGSSQSGAPQPNFPATSTTQTGSAVTTTTMPTWLDSVYPTPNSTATVPVVVEVLHRLQSTEDHIRLLIDGVDVTSNATFDVGELKYTSGDGPVVLSPGEHTATVEEVVRPNYGSTFTVLDSYSWSFEVG